jgi:heme exporter protein A
MLLTAKQISKFFGPKLVFKNIDLSVAEGEIVLLVGANGTGKSTLLRILSGLARPTQGNVQSELDEAGIGYMGHETFIYPQMTALENLRFWARLYGLQSEYKHYMGLLKKVGLAGLAQERPAHFSRGMIQRLSLARVLLIEPVLLFLDEPSTGLDRSSQGLLKEEIIAARTRGAGIVWVSHHEEDDLQLANRVFVLKDKKGILFSSPQERLAALKLESEYEPGECACN